MDLKAAGQLRKEIDKAVTSGDAGIPHECLASIKGLVRADPVHAPNVAIETLLHHLKASHSQVIQETNIALATQYTNTRASMHVNQAAHTNTRANTHVNLQIN
jgi:hypothetical protein